MDLIPVLNLRSGPQEMWIVLGGCLWFKLSFCQVNIFTLNPKFRLSGNIEKYCVLLVRYSLLKELIVY